MVARDARVRLLRSVPFFSGCSEHELEALADVLDERVVDAGTDVVREGDRTRDFYVIVSGTAQVSRRGAPARTLEAGDFFGEVALLLQARRFATVTATSPLELLVAEQPAFFRLINAIDGLHAKMIDALAERLAPTAL
jgi:cAMP-dependent protein kinase regulator